MKEYQINNFTEKLYYEKLDNGLRIFLVPLKNKKNFSCMMFTKYGGRDINFKIDGKLQEVPTGIAHFLEHKMFDRKDDPFKFYQKFGTDVNASTSNDYTGYYFIGNKSFEKSLKYLVNWIKNLELTEESVKKEQGIILEEASMYKDNPDRVLYSKVRENSFKIDPSKNKVIGTDEDIKSITKEQLELCYKHFYSPDNMIIIATGNFDQEKAIKIIKDETKDFVSINKKIERIYGEEPDEVAKEYEEVSLNVETPKVASVYKINKSVLKDLNLSSFELDVYLHCLINIALGTTSLIRQQWLNEGLFINSFYRISEIESHYLIEFYAITTKSDELINKLDEYIKVMEIDKETFEREKKLWIAHETRIIDNVTSTLYSIVDDLLDYDEFIPNKIEYIKKLDFSLLETIKERLTFENKSVIKIIPNK